MMRKKNKLLYFVLISLLMFAVSAFTIACNNGDDSNNGDNGDTIVEIVRPQTTEGLKIENGKLVGFDKTVWGETAPTKIALPDSVTSIADGLFKGSKVELFYADGLLSVDDETFINCTDLLAFSSKSVKSIGQNAFYNCLSLVKVEIDEVERVGQRAFFNSYIKEVSLEKTTSVGEQAFGANTALESVSLPKVANEGLSESVFDGCERLTSVNLPLVTRIPDNTFSGCFSLSSFDFSKITEIGNSAFNRTALTSLDLPLVSGIGNYAFSATKLKNVNIPNISSMGRSVFSGCVDLASVSIPNLTVVSSETFKGCESLLTVSLPKVTEIKERGFQHSGITEFDFSNITAIEADAFNSTKLVSVSAPLLTVLNNGVFQTISTLTTVSLPLVTTAGMQVFSDCTALSSVSIPLLTETGIAAFNACTALQTITLPKLATIGRMTFANCTALKTAELALVKRIGEAAFMNCTALTAFDFATVIEIRANAFENSGLKKVELFVSKLETNAFYRCFDLAEVVMDSMTEIREYAFAECTKLKEVTAPELTKIGRYSFLGCTSLKSVSMAKVTKLGANAFENCKVLEQVSMPSLKKLNDYVFYNCSSLKEFDFSNIVDESLNISSADSFDLTGNYMRGEFAFSGSGLESVTLPASGFSEIPFGMFSGCTKLKEINLGGVATIGAQAFVNCKALTSIDLVKVKKLGSRNSGSTFSGCTGINIIILSKTLTTIIGDSHFSGWKDTQKIGIGYADEESLPNTWVELSVWYRGSKATIIYS